MAKTSQRELKKEVKNSGINLKELFPKSKIKGNRNFTPYQLRKIKKALHEAKKPEGVTGVTGSFKPDRPEHYEAAGFIRDGKTIYTTSEKIQIHTVYKHEGESSFYSASFFGGIAHVQLIPLLKLPEFLEHQIKVDESEGKFYDKITLREGDRDMHGFSKGFENMKDSAEELLEYLMQYKRHGALIGEGGSYDYIQVCFINFGG